MQNVWMIRNLVGIAGLLYLCFEDIRTQEVRLTAIVLWGIAGLILSIGMGEWWNIQILYRFVPGAMCLILGRISQEAVGYGDGLILLMLGSYLRLDQIATLTMVSTMLAGIAALILIVAFHKKRKARIPFVPFMLIGYGVSLW